MGKIPKESTKLIDKIIEAIEKKKGSEIVSLDLREIPESICDFFIICSGDVPPHVKAIAEEVEYLVKKDLKALTSHREGYENLEWVILDYFDIVVHVFQKEKRDFFKLEELWSDAKMTEHSS